MFFFCCSAWAIVVVRYVLSAGSEDKVTPLLLLAKASDCGPSKMVNGYNKNSLNSLLLVRFDLIKEEISSGDRRVHEKVTPSLSVTGLVLLFVC